MNIIGIGTDVVNVDRIKKASSDENFLSRILTAKELDSIDKNSKHIYERYAGRFAAKEAIVKSLGIGFNKDIKATDIEIINNELGKPIVTILNDNYKDIHVELSISHTEDIATAYAISFKD